MAKKAAKFVPKDGSIKKIGRPTVFERGGNRNYQIKCLSPQSTADFERIRAEVKRLHAWSGHVTDADTVEYLVRLWRTLNGEPKVDVVKT